MPQPHEKKLEIATRRKQVAALYLRRFTQQQIADQLGYCQKTVSSDIAAILADYRKERTDHIDREVAELEEMERDAALQFHGTKAREWISERRAIKERRAKMLGLDAPAKQEVSGPNGGPLLLAAVDIDDCDDANFKERMAEAGAFFAALRLPPEP